MREHRESATSDVQRAMKSLQGKTGGIPSVHNPLARDSCSHLQSRFYDFAV